MSYSNFIHIALAFNDVKGTYARHAAVTIASIFENTSSHVCVHVLHDDTLTAYNRDAFEKLALKYAQTIEFHNVTKAFGSRKAELKDLGKRSQLTVGTLFRLLIPELLNCDKLIYLDCDIVVTLDIAELWNIDMQGKAVAAVRDFMSLDKFTIGKPIGWRQSKIWKMWGVADDEYFNAGVLLMDLKKIHENYDMLKSLGNFVTLNQSFVSGADQDYLNWLFTDDKLLIDTRFNRYRADGATEENRTGVIWHVLWKPWLNYAHPAVDDLYWMYLRKTPFCNSDMELLRLALTDLSSSRYMHRHSSACIKRLKQQLHENIFRTHVLCIPNLIYCLLFSPHRSYKDVQSKS